MTQELRDVIEAELEQPFHVRDLNKERVAIYAETPDDLPPILVFRVDRRLILVDGRHRVMAWAQNGRLAFPAVIREGSMLEAETAAGTANLHHGQPLSRKERQAWAERMVKLHGSQRKAAEAVGVSPRRLSDWVNPGARAPKARVANAESLVRSARLAEAPDEIREQIGEAAKQRNWTGAEIETAIEAVQDQRLPEETRDAILAGEEDPVRINADGKPTYHLDTLGRSLKDAKRSDPAVLWYAAREAMENLVVHVPVEDLVAVVGDEGRQEWVTVQLRGYVTYLQEFLERQSDRGFRVVG